MAPSDPHPYTLCSRCQQPGVAQYHLDMAQIRVCANCLTEEEKERLTHATDSD